MDIGIEKGHWHTVAMLLEIDITVYKKIQKI